NLCPLWPNLPPSHKSFLARKLRPLPETLPVCVEPLSALLSRTGCGESQSHWPGYLTLLDPSVWQSIKISSLSSGHANEMIVSDFLQRLPPSLPPAKSDQKSERKRGR